jgi:glycosyltransferase involved in cell wall biosynthesis
MVSEHANPMAAIRGADAGGQNVHVAALSAALADLGNRVTVYTRRDAPDAPTTTQLCRGVTVELIGAGPPRPVSKDELLPYMDEFGDQLADRFLVARPHVVHAHFWMSGVAAQRGAEPQGVPVVQTYHALGAVKRRHLGAADPSPPDRVRHELRIGRRAAHIIATCDDEVSELVAMGLARHRTSVVPCGVDLARFTPDGPVAIRSSSRRLLSVGRLVERKGIDVAVRALADLPDTELVIAGGPSEGDVYDDPEARRLLAVAAEVGVADRVVMLGTVAREHMPALIRSADAVVCTPWYEPFGIVPLEAMACGVPVVASAVGGLRDSVVDGETGLHVPPNDVPALTAALRRLADEPGLAEALGRGGAARASDRYGWPVVARGTAEVYRRVVARDRSARREAVKG